MHHSHAHRPATKGVTIHWSGAYYNIFGRLIRRSDATIVKLAGIQAGAKVLDLGCGPGSLTQQIKKAAGASGEVYGLDASPEMIALAKEQASKNQTAVNFQVGVIEALPFADASFDTVVSRLVIHHLPGDELKLAGFREMLRVLKPGGQLLIIDFETSGLPFFQKHPKLAFGLAPMFKINIRNYKPLVEEAGFEKVEVGPTGARLLSFVRGWK